MVQYVVCNASIYWEWVVLNMAANIFVVYRRMFCFLQKFTMKHSYILGLLSFTFTDREKNCTDDVKLISIVNECMTMLFGSITDSGSFVNFKFLTKFWIKIYTYLLFTSMMVCTVLKVMRWKLIPKWFDFKSFFVRRLKYKNINMLTLRYSLCFNRLFLGIVRGYKIVQISYTTELKFTRKIRYPVIQVKYSVMNLFCFDVIVIIIMQ